MTDVTGETVAERNSGLLPLLQRSHNRISRELRTVKQERDEIQSAISVSDDQIQKLETIDRLTEAVKTIRGDNAKINNLLGSLSTRANELRDELSGLRREREQSQTAHSEAVQRRDHLTELKSKVLPEAQFRELERTLARDAAELKTILEDIKRLEKAVPLLVSEKEGLERQLEETAKQIPGIRERTEVLNGRVARLAPKVIEKEAVDQLEADVRSLKARKEGLVEENQILTPKIANLSAEADTAASTVDAYEQKNQKDRVKISTYEDEIRELGADLDDETVARLTQELSEIESDLEAKSGSFKVLKTEYDALLAANQGFKSTIQEVETKTRRLKARMSIKSLINRE